MSINPASLNRITGLASGMDTDSLVKKLMAGEQAKLDQLNQKLQKDTWQSDAYRQWNTDLVSFQSSTLFNMKMSSTYNTFNVSASDPNSVSGSAGGGAFAGTYNIQVKQLAKSATFTSNKVALNTTQPLSNQGSLSVTNSSTITISVMNGTTSSPLSAKITIDPTKTINDVVNSINSAVDSTTGQSLGVQAIYDSNLQQFVLKTNATGAATKINLTGTDPSFLSNTLGLGSNNTLSGTTNSSTTITSGSNDSLTIDLGNGTSSNITLKAGTYNTPQDLVNEINNEIAGNSTLATKVSASIDSNGNLTFTSSATGSQSPLNVSGTASSTIWSATPTSSLTANGQNADIIFNGSEINTLSSNTASIMGINWTFKTPTVDSGGNLTTNTVNVSQDIDTEVKNITDFISKYNDILDKLNTAYSEPVYKDYQPLTDAQKSSMTDTQVQQWETKAKSGLLHNDSILNTLINSMRNDMTSVVNNGSTYNSLASIGISSSSYLDKGKLYIDQDKLRTALQNDPNAVTKLFSNLDTTDSSKNGLMNKLNDDISSAVTSLTDKAGSTGNSYYDQSTLGKMMTSLQSQISTENDSFNTKENQYYTQFSAMEQAMQKYTSQSSWLTSQLGAASAG
ncbi:flagellar filament capping protein FliD [Bacillus sp. BRMEA1]|uniref:flagellar filament capping protein FliD n=1 Tax=Neobacillus endophyticus TaxID=2738405 RepID=UPI001566B040|nr:flagellar filament capping protein FliD [Neobacillus endophyticus]NRD79389.1 flagellar filament capping protein FliD [Neobacillus endophyticus]